MTTRQPVLLAGVPWPRYKLVALLAGLVTFLIVGLLTTSAAPSVLAAAAVSVVSGLTFKALSRA
ncbi:hypothetical protein [Mycobacterium sp. MFM001]|uniref:hypothetical protein n=1 Tax=Mycobacterium sp. MFM001 TaxID=2049453 RepID=UPI001864C678|nr:hypothetical protein [Mycobacterium sp. MFM001]